MPHMVEDLRNALAEMEPIAAIHTLLDTASAIADGASQDETHATGPYTFLAQLIDTALARAEHHLEDVLGYKPCGNLGWDSDGNPTLCLQRFGVEHSHG